MTIPATSRVSPIYQGNASATLFAFSYKTYAKQELQVIVSDGVTPQTLTLDSDYSVALNADQITTPGGVISYPISGSPLAAGLTLVIVSAVPNQQDVSLPTGGAFNASSVELGFDRLEVQIQQFNDTLNRTIRVPVGESISSPLPAALTRANYLLGFDGLGNPVAVAPVNGSATGLATDLTSTSVATKGAGQVGFLYSLGYAAGTVGKWLKDLALGTGAGFVGFDMGLAYAANTVGFKLKGINSICDVLNGAVGAVADGNIVAGTGTDNTARIQARINALGVNGCLFVPPGVFKCSGQITIPSEFTLYGAGKYCSILTAPNAFNADGLLKCNGIGGAPTNVRGLGVIAQNGGAGAASQGVNSIANGVFIDDVWVSGFNTNVTLGSSDNFLTNSAIEEAASGGTGINIPSTDVTVSDVTLYHCYVGMAVHDFAYLDGTVTITNVRANACTLESFLISNANNVQFAGCSVGGVAGQNATAGINCINSNNISFDGMLVHQAGTSTTAPGLLISGGSNITVDGGQYQGWLDGIQANNVSGLTITGPQCMNNFRRGVFASGGDRVVLMGGLSANDGSVATSDAGVYLLNSASSSIFSVVGWTCTQNSGGAQEYGIFANLTDNGASTGYINLTGNTCLFNNTADIALSGAVQNIAYQSSGNVAGTITGGFTAVTSASTVSLPIVGEAIGIFGNTTINTITNPLAGRRVTLVFSSSLTVVDGSNLKLAGNLATGPNTTLTLVGDGTNWYEIGRSVN